MDEELAMEEIECGYVSTSRRPGYKAALKVYYLLDRHRPHLY